ncbi:MAG: hypothetical protein JXA78_05060 [Anaerolineales bacterium]|nr:hypothetical protein [Anaerolineales bacterium]
MNQPGQLSILKKLVLPALALVLGFGAAALLLSQAQTALASAQAIAAAWDAASFDVGGSNACAVTSSGGLKCWGDNFYGQLGDGTTDNSGAPVDVSGLTSGVAAVSAGPYFACALTDGSGVQCWGDNQYGQLGDGTNDESHTPVQVSGLASGAAAVASGGESACALMTGGGVQCWGANWAGQLGDGTTNDSNVPVTVTVSPGGDPLSGVAAIDVGYGHACALMTGGGVRCWGFNWYGQLGDGSNADSSVPVTVAVSLGGDPLNGVVGISAGDSHTCAALANGEARCWGDNDNGQLGDGNSETGSYSPVTVTVSLGGSPLGGIAAVAAGNRHSCALMDSGGAKCWGANDEGQLGDDSTIDRLSPVDVVDLADAAAIAAGLHNSTCARLESGRIKCWGSNEIGQLGNGSLGYRTTPVDVLGAGAGVTDIKAGDDFTCAVINGGAKCWGENDHGKLGDDSTNPSSTPVDVFNLTSGIVAVAAGEDHACALTTGGGVKCWGYNWRGELGDGTTDERHTPVDAYGLGSGVAEVDTGNMFTCARTSAGKVQCWGSNIFSQLGIGTDSIFESHTPVTVTLSFGGDPLNGVTDIALGEYHACALVGGGVKCWGYNSNGQLGDNSTSERSSPVDVVGLGSGVASITAGGNHTCAVMAADGSVRCWGYNWNGQLGDGNSFTESHTPVTVTLSGGAPLIGSAAAAGGGSHTCARMTGGGVQCWGANWNGQLGDGTIDDSYSPVAVSGLADAAAITAGGHHTCARTSGGAAKCWGDNYDGQLGIGEFGYFTTPVWVIGFGDLQLFFPIVMR